MEINAFSAGLAGMQSAYQTVNNAATNIATQSGARINGAEKTDSNLARDLVNLRVGQRDAEASANVLRSGDKMLGSLLDVMA